MLDNLNSVNAGQPEVVAPAATDNSTSVVADTQQPAGDVATPQNNQPQSKEENSKYAEMRRGKETAEKELNTLKNTNKKLMDALNSLGYEGSETDIMDKLSAERAGLSVDEYRTKEREHNERILKDPRVVEAQKVLRERQFEKDLNAIKEAYPDVTAKSVLELGDVYLNIMRTGGASPVDAYAAQLAFNEREKAKVPPEIGAVNTTTPAKKDFYTPEEVDKLTSKDLDDPDVMDIVLKSMKKWPLK